MSGRVFAATLLPLLFGGKISAAESSRSVVRQPEFLLILSSQSAQTALTAQSTLGDLLPIPLQGFADRILSWPGRNHDHDMPISQNARLPCYHSDIRPLVVRDGINRIIAETGALMPDLGQVIVQDKIEAPIIRCMACRDIPSHRQAPLMRR